MQINISLENRPANRGEVARGDVIECGEKRIMLPADNEPIFECDEILLCGTGHSETILSATINNACTLHYLVTGIDAPRGYLFRWFAGKLNGSSVLN